MAMFPSKPSFRRLLTKLTHHFTHPVHIMALFSSTLRFQDLPRIIYQPKEVMGNRLQDLAVQACARMTPDPPVGESSRPGGQVSSQGLGYDYLYEMN